MFVKKDTKWLVILILVAFVAGLIVTRAIAADDLRSYQHGVDLVPRGDGQYWLIWSSSGNPPRGQWTHDIYRALINPTCPSITPQTLISRSGAQEQSSADVSADGKIMVVTEDDWNVSNLVATRYGVYNASDLSGVKPYPQMTYDGGHSAHVSAVGNRFVVWYGDEWCDGGGVDNLGSGRDLKVAVYDSSGNLERHEYIQGPGNCNIAAQRNWWPIVAGSSDRAFLLWQRFVSSSASYAKLMYQVYNPVDGSLMPASPVQIEGAVEFYTYDVQYYPSIDRFLVVGTYNSGGGFAYLFDNNGTIVAQNTALPAIPREVQPAERAFSDGVKVVYPRSPNGALVLWVTGSSISLDQTISDSYNWSYIGTDGIFLNDTQAYFVSGSASGLVQKTFFLSSVMANKIYLPYLSCIVRTPPNQRLQPTAFGAGMRVP